MPLLCVSHTHTTRWKSVFYFINPTCPTRFVFLPLPSSALIDRPKHSLCAHKNIHLWWHPLFRQLNQYIDLNRTKLLPNFNKGIDGVVDLFGGVGGGNLTPNASGALWHDGVTETNDKPVGSEMEGY